MRKRIRCRVLCFALVFVSMLLCAAPAFARAALPAPIVYVGGFGTELFENPGTAAETEIFFSQLGTDAVVAALGTVALEQLQAPLRLLFGRQRTADFLVAFVLRWLGRIACDANGNSINNVTGRRGNAAPGYHSSGRQFWSFLPDWRLDPMQEARALAEYIAYVQQESCSERVALQLHSYGGIVGCAYLEQFGTDAIESVFLDVSAHGGVVLAQELLQKRLEVSGAGLAAFLRENIADPSGKFATAADALEWLGCFDALEWLANPLLARMSDTLYGEAVVPLLAQMPAVWAFVTEDAAYEKAKALLLNDAEKYAQLIARIDDYHYNVGNRTDEILRETAAEVKLALLCSYDLAPIPLGGQALYQSDFLIGTAQESGGAICAPYGQTFPQGYTQAIPGEKNFISPDRVVDASACPLPEYTWFIRGRRHGFGSDLGLYEWFLAQEAQPSVFSDAAYPQFM
ncbi:MAG: hypothetical protein LBC83_03730 [Oscillospiraceae bacterium]|jgi:hypothetical protein|nr:hypothetical protein [Oscillospiraceae bacterium]